MPTYTRYSVPSPEILSEPDFFSSSKNGALISSSDTRDRRRNSFSPTPPLPPPPPLQLRALSSFFGGDDEESAGSDTQALIRYFASSAAGTQPPPFVRMTFDEACADAKARGKQYEPSYLIVYLHSSAHPDTALFRTVLCSPEFRELCVDAAGPLDSSEHGGSSDSSGDAQRSAGASASSVDRCCTLWGGDVSRRDGFAVASQKLMATRYPYVAVLHVPHVEATNAAALANRTGDQKSAHAICIMEGAVELKHCVHTIREATTAHRRSLRTTRQLRETQRADSDRRRDLMLAQDREAEESARQDRERVRCVLLCEQWERERERERESARVHTLLSHVASSFDTFLFIQTVLLL